MSPTFEFVGGTPWARQQLVREGEPAIAAARRAMELGIHVSIMGKTASGPWVVRVGRDNHRVLRFAGHSPLADIIAFGLDRWVAGADDTGIRWLAGSDGLAHAQLDRNRPVWTLCQRPALDERYMHPERSRCTACWKALDRDVRAVAGAA